MPQWIELANFPSRASVRRDSAARPRCSRRISMARFSMLWMRRSSRGVGDAPRGPHATIAASSGPYLRLQRSRRTLPPAALPVERCAPASLGLERRGTRECRQEYEETAAREMAEELGVDRAVEQIGAIPACVETGWEFVRLYRARHEGPFALPPAEIETGGWFTPRSDRPMDRGPARRFRDRLPGMLACSQGQRGGQAARRFSLTIHPSFS